MKEVVHVSVVQFAAEWLGLDKNIERMRSLAEAEAKEGAELIVFPELANLGYITPVLPGETCGFEGMTYMEFASRYVRLAEPIPGPTTEALSEITRKYGVYIVVGLAQKHPVIPAGSLYNSAALIGPRGVVGVHHKMHIAYNEKHFFYSGNTSEVFNTDLGNIGMVICYDARFPEITRILTLKGAEIVCCPWAVPTQAGPDSIKYRSYTRAQENAIFFISSNRTGQEGKYQYMGHSCIAAPTGAIIAASKTTDEEAIRAELKEVDLITSRSMMSIFRDRRPEMYGLLTKPLSAPFKPGVVITPEEEPAPSQATPES
ncbi:carbon-nitrogen hydrolase family protein [Chloroflexota bacterium]